MLGDQLASEHFRRVKLCGKEFYGEAPMAPFRLHSASSFRRALAVAVVAALEAFVCRVTRKATSSTRLNPY